MPRIDLSLDPVDHITVDAIGKPGERVFYIQGRKGQEIVTLIIEKIQLQSLIIGIKDFLEEIANRFTTLSEPILDFQEEEMQILPPVDPLFRVGDMGLAYDDEKDLVCIIAKEIQSEGDKSERSVVRFWCSRSKLLAISHWAAIVVERGRPICPQCLQPMEPEGHFCPKKNGHKKAKPVD
jgi:uncharacterized repeat protein (TIGR03847 family)